MRLLIQYLNRLRSLLDFLSWVPPLLARITIAWVFIQSGWGKLHHLDKVTAFFTDLGLPMPGFQAHLVANTEFVGGILILVGLLTRIASVPLTIIMYVAIATAKRDELHGFSDLVGFSEYLYMVLLVWFLFTGPGLLSLDTIFSSKLKKMD